MKTKTFTAITAALLLCGCKYRAPQSSDSKDTLRIIYARGSMGESYRINVCTVEIDGVECKMQGDEPA